MEFAPASRELKCAALQEEWTADKGEDVRGASARLIESVCELAKRPTQ